MRKTQNKFKNKFRRDKIKFFLPKSFKGLSREYILDCIFNKEIQSKWYPQEGDIIVTDTGNMYVISGEHNLVEELGGKTFFFGGGYCVKGEGHIADDTYCFTMNEFGVYYNYDSEGNIKPTDNLYHSSWKEFRFVPYPHELERIKGGKANGS